MDDYYITHILQNSSKFNLVVMETTVNTYNTSLVEFIDPEGRCVMNWIRVQLSNFLATNPIEWTVFFSI